MAERKTSGTTKLPLAILGVLYAALAVAYSLAIPPEWSMDEDHHFAYVQEVLLARRLPRLRPDASAEEFQPPLYYVAAAAAGTAVERAGGAARLGISEPLLDLLVARWLSVLAGVLTLWCGWRLAGLVFPTQPVQRSLTVVVTAFSPTFLAVSGSVSNDGLAAALASVAVLAAAESAVSGPSTRRAAIGGLALGLGALTKLSALVAIVPVGLGLALAAGAWRRPSGILRDAGVAGGAVLASAGWWWWRGWALDQDPFGRKAQALLQPSMVLPGPVPLGDYPAHLHDLLRTYLGSLGQNGIVRLPEWVYWVWIGVVALALAGVARTLWRRPTDRVWNDGRGRVVLLGAAVVAANALALLSYANSFQGAWHGRLLLPAGGAIAVLMVVGLNALSRARYAAFGLLGALFVVPAVLVPIVTLPDVRAAQQLEPASAAAIQHETDYEIAGAIHLDGIAYRSPTVNAGDRAVVTGFWRATGRVNDPWTVFLHLADADGRLLAQSDAPPLPAIRFWPPDRLFAQHYELVVPGGVLPGLYDLQLGLYKRSGDALVYPAATSAAGPANARGLGVGRLKVRWPTYPPPRQAQAVGFEDSVELLGWDWTAGDLTLRWRARGTPRKSYTVFVQFLDSSGHVAVQHDGLPAAANFPTDRWEAGDVIVDPHPVRAPAGGYSVIVGMYDLNTGRRLSTCAGSDHAGLGSVEVRASGELLSAGPTVPATCGPGAGGTGRPG